MEEELSKIKIELLIPRQTLIDLRRKLFMAGISLQDFFSQVAILAEKNDPLIEPTFDFIAEKKRLNIQFDGTQKITVTSIYKAIEDSSPLKER